MIKSPDILNEIKSISEVCAGLPQNNPFEVPEGYFEQFPPKMIHVIRKSEAADELSGSPLLSSLKGENPFQVPAGYFNQVVFQPPVEEKKIIRMFERRNTWKFAVAASLAGLVLTVFSLLFNAGQHDQFVYFADTTSKTGNLSQDALRTYLNEMDQLSFSTPHSEVLNPNESLWVQMDSETISSLLSQLPDTGIEQFMNERNNESFNIN